MAIPTAMDEYFVHQIPECLPSVAVHHHHWREGYFFKLPHPSGPGGAVFFPMGPHPAQDRMDSLQMGRVGGEQVLGVKGRPYDGDPHTTEVPGARVEVVTPMREVRLWAEPADDAIGLDLTWRARTQPYALRRGTMRASHELVWDQSHILQSGNYTGTYTFDGAVREVAGWIGERDHSWGSATTAAARCGSGGRSSSTTGSSASGTGSSRTARSCTATAAGPAPTCRSRFPSSTSATTPSGSGPTGTR